ncbi:hypothetical protein H0H93_015594, partial [Arthromyces matolae]
WNLHTGHLLVRFEHDRRRLNARNPSDNDRVVIRILKILQPVRVTKPTPRDLERMSFVDQNYPEYFPCEGELLHSRWIDHNQDQQTTPIIPLDGAKAAEAGLSAVSVDNTHVVYY